MKTLSASNAKNSFGELLDLSQREPVRIEKKGCGVAVVLSIEECERPNDLEDQWWAAQARQAEKKGFLGGKASTALLKELLNASD